MGKLRGLGRSNIVGFIALFLAFSIATPAWSAPGDRDPSFSDDGLADMPVAGTRPNSTTPVPLTGTAVEPLPGGGMLIGGYVADSTLQESRLPPTLALAKLNADGSLDESFAGDGTANTSFGGYRLAFDIEQLSDGRILVAGRTGDEEASFIGGNEQASFVRFLPNGSLDTSFSEDGILALDLSDFDGIFQMSATDGGAVVAAGTSTGKLLIVKLLASGDPDTSFAGDGILTTEQDEASGIAVQPDGKILVSGKTNALARFNADGTLDQSFGAGGLTGALGAGLTFERDEVTIRSVALSLGPDGTAVVAGTAGYEAPGPHGFTQPRTQTFLARYTTGGELDPTFSGDGAVVRSSTAGGAADLETQDDGRYVLAGFNELARFLPDGTLDSSFSGGIRESPIGERIEDLAIDPEGRLVVLGSFRVGRLLNSAGPSNADADGVLDEEDRCPDVFGAPDDCPLIERKFPRFDYSKKRRAFVGRIRVPPGVGCAQDERVIIKRKRPGRDERIAKDLTNRGGYVFQRHPMREGTYYAVLKPTVVPVSGLCSGARSDKETI